METKRVLCGREEILDRIRGTLNSYKDMKSNYDGGDMFVEARTEQAIYVLEELLAEFDLKFRQSLGMGPRLPDDVY